MPRVIGYEDRLVSCEVGETFEIRLKATPTGCRWISPSPGVEVEIASVTVDETIGAIGSGVSDRFLVTAKSAGKVTLVFEKESPWSTEIDEVWQLDITIVASE